MSPRSEWLGSPSAAITCAAVPIMTGSQNMYYNSKASPPWLFAGMGTASSRAHREATVLSLTIKGKPLRWPHFYRYISVSL